MRSVALVSEGGVRGVFAREGRTAFVREACSLVGFVGTCCPSSGVPVCLFSSRGYVFYVPRRGRLACPPFRCLRRLFSNSSHVARYAARCKVVFYSLGMSSSRGERLIFNPIAAIPCSSSSLRRLCGSCVISGSDHSSFGSFLHRVPYLSLDSLLGGYVFLGCYLRRRLLSLRRLASIKRTMSRGSIVSSPSLLLRRACRGGRGRRRGRACVLRRRLLELIHANSYRKFGEFTCDRDGFRVNIANSATLHRLGGGVVVAAALYAHTTVRNKLSCSATCRLSSCFVRSSRQLADTSQLASLLKGVDCAFTRGMTRTGAPISASRHVRGTVQCVRRGAGRRLAIKSITSCIKFDGSCFSTCFGGALNFSIDTFVLHYGLRRKERLLRCASGSVDAVDRFLYFSDRDRFRATFGGRFKEAPSRCEARLSR